MIRTLCALTLLFALPGATILSAQEARTVATKDATAGTLLKGKISGDQSARYVVSGNEGQILSVDLLSSNLSANFNILAVGAETALFAGSTVGTVADVPLPAAGDYVIEIYLERSAARRNEGADYSLGITLNGADFADSLAGGPDYWAVSGLSDGDALNIRSGPAVRYPAIGKLSNGEVLQNKGCRLTAGTRWCGIRASGSGATGWVAGRYLIEAAAPTAPTTPEGGPVGNGNPFDATGSIACATSQSQPLHDCLFGVVREGPGNAGVWITLTSDTERQILFEKGEPVTANVDADLRFKKTEGLFQITVGEERYEIPDAVVYGG